MYIFIYDHILKFFETLNTFLMNDNANINICYNCPLCILVVIVLSTHNSCNIYTIHKHKNKLTNKYIKKNMNAFNFKFKMFQLFQVLVL